MSVVAPASLDDLGPHKRPTTFITISPSAHTNAAGRNKMVSISLNVGQMKEHVSSAAKPSGSATHKIIVRGLSLTSGRG